jgi:hypothetical protein
VFSVASKFATLYGRRTVVLFVLVVVAVVAGRFGVPAGMWDGPLGG